MRSRSNRPTTIARWRLLALISILALVAVACGETATDTEPDPDDDAAEEEPDAEPAALQELIVGTSADPWIDSESDRKRRPNYPLNADVCETLVKLGTDFSTQPSVASDWELVGDNTFRFTVAEGVTFSDGTPVDAEAVKYSIDYTTQEPTTGSSFLGPDSTVVVDDMTVEVTPEESNLRLIEQIDHPTFAVIKPGSDPLNDPLVECTGPFMVVEYVAEEHLIVERNDNYWGEPALLDRIEFRFIPDDTTRTLALQNGEVDMITDVPRGILTTIEALPGIKVQEAPIGQVFLAYVSRRDADESDRLMADPLVRRAAAAAIDQDEFVDGVLDGNGAAIPSVAPVEVFGEFADTLEGVPYDPEEAGRLLDEAGWTLQDGEEFRSKDGEPLVLTIIFSPGSGGTGVGMATVEYVQSKLREVGFDARVDQLDSGGYSDRLANGAYDLDIAGPNQNNANPAFLMGLRWYSKARGPNAPWISPGPDTEYERLIDAVHVETDPVELRRLSAEAMRELVHEEVAGIPLAGVYRIYAMREEVQGFQPHPSSTNQRWSTVFIGE